MCQRQVPPESHNCQIEKCQTEGHRRGLSNTPHARVPGPTVTSACSHIQPRHPGYSTNIQHEVTVKK